MLLVLGVIAVFAGMAIPSVLRMYNQQKITASAERVREAIASARVRAIETGLIYQFCCEPNGTSYVVVPFEPDHSGGNNGQQGTVTLASRASGQLPKGIVFSSLNVVNVPNAGSGPVGGVGQQKIATSALDGLPNSAALSGLNWSSPVLFKPDGSAGSDTEIVLTDTHSQYITIRIRAFTGAVSMLPLVARKR
jgi:hypothetical protein